MSRLRPHDQQQASPPSDVTQQEPARWGKARESSAIEQQRQQETGKRGIFSRLLRARKGSKRQKKPSHDQYTSLPDSPSGAAADVEDATPSRHHLVEDAPLAALEPPQRPKTAPGVRTTVTPPETAAAKVPGAITLKRKASLRDRFRSMTASTPSPAQQTQTPQPVYVPTHAAADFSRLGVSPRYRASQDEDRKLSSQLERLTPIESHPTEDDVERAETPRTSLTSSQRPDEAPLTQIEHLRDHKSSGQPPDHGHGSQQLPRDPSHSQQDPLPSSAPDISPRKSSDDCARRHLDDGEQDVQPTGESANSGELPRTGKPEPPSDYEQFIAQAEAEERTHRTQLWRGLSAASRLPQTAARYSPPALDEIPEAVMTIPGDFSTGTTAVNRPKRDSYQLARQGGHAKRATWDSGFSSSYVVHGERQSSDLPAATYVGAASGIDYAAQQPRGLKRQTSLAKRVAEYIRPPREHDAAGYEEPASRLGGRATTRGGAARW